MVYQFRSGSHLTGDAQAVGEALNRIHSAHGKITPPTVVKEAKNKKSPLNGYFEWNNAEAADRYRLEQARHLIAAVVVVKTEEDKPGPATRAFISIRDTEPTETGEVDKTLTARAYLPTTYVLARPDLREMALADIRASIGTLRRKLADFEELAGLIEEVDAIGQQIEARFATASAKSESALVAA